MAGKFLSAACVGALVAGSFYPFGDMQADSQARLALLNPPVGTEVEGAAY